MVIIVQLCEKHYNSSIVNFKRMDLMVYEIYLDKNLIEKITKYAMQRSRKAWPIMNRKINRNSPTTDRDLELADIDIWKVLIIAFHMFKRLNRDRKKF